MRSVFQGFDDLYSTEATDGAEAGGDDEDDEEDLDAEGESGDGEGEGGKEGGGGGIHTKPRGPFKAERFTAGEL